MTTTTRSYTTTGTELLVDEGRVLAGQLVGWHCPCCGRRMHRGAASPDQLQIDHWFPCAAGGADMVIGNLIPLCAACNAVKKDEIDHIKWIKRALANVRGNKTTRGMGALAPAVLAHLIEVREELTNLLKSKGIW